MNKIKLASLVMVAGLIAAVACVPMGAEAQVATGTAAAGVGVGAAGAAAAGVGAAGAAAAGVGAAGTAATAAAGVGAAGTAGAPAAVVSSTAPEIASTAPAVVSTAPAVVSTAPAVVSTAPEIASTAPAVVSTAPEIASTAPAVASNAPEIASNAPAVASNAPAVASTAPEKEIIGKYETYDDAMAVLEKLPAGSTISRDYGSDYFTVNKVAETPGKEAMPYEADLPSKEAKLQELIGAYEKYEAAFQEADLPGRRGVPEGGYTPFGEPIKEFLRNPIKSFKEDPRGTTITAVKEVKEIVEQAGGKKLPYVGNVLTAIDAGNTAYNTWTRTHDLPGTFLAASDQITGVTDITRVPTETIVTDVLIEELTGVGLPPDSFRADSWLYTNIIYPAAKLSLQLQ
jgi:hypothetical protein